jgi:hypothetical protein
MRAAKIKKGNRLKPRNSSFFISRFCLFFRGCAYLNFVVLPLFYTAISYLAYPGKILHFDYDLYTRLNVYPIQ